MTSPSSFVPSKENPPPKPSNGEILPGLACAVLWTLSASVLFGWWLNIDRLQRVLPASVAMNPMTAVAFILLGIALWLSLPDKPPKLPRETKLLTVRVCVAMVLLVAVERLTGYLFGFETHLDRLLFTDRLDLVDGEIPNRMAPHTAFSFLLAGSALLFLDAPARTWRVCSQAPALLLVLAAFVGFVGYTVGAPGLYKPLPFIGMAVHTSFGFVVLGIGILAARPDRGLAGIVSSPRLGGAMARVMLPVAVLAPLLIGWTRLLGERQGLYGTEFGLGILITVWAVFLSALTLKTAASLNRLDAVQIKAREAAELSAQRLEHALDLAESAILTIDSAQRITSFDERAARLFGYAPEEVLGKPIDILLPERFVEIHRKHVAEFIRSGEGARRMGVRREVFGRRKDGSEFPAEAAISKSIAEDRLLLTVVIRDVTDRKRVELETLRAERLAAANQELEAFSYSVSHDLRAPLRHVDGFVELLQKRIADTLDPQSRRYLDTIADSAKQMANLIDALLSFSRMARAEINTSEVKLGILLEEVLKELSPEISARNITWRIDPLPTVECDPALMKLVFQNLVGNALKFTRTREQARIEIGTEPGRYGEIVVHVRDNGVGFDKQYQAKLFGVFQRLHRKEDFEGTGIGLANVRRIILRHGGEVWAESEVGAGATFFFSIPMREEATT
ncbi:MAG: Adaptive-response sensory-kinase SasA [bacterium]|nr:Adaptive-response sensory-kinase SasA [bacterium]